MFNIYSGSGYKNRNCVWIVVMVIQKPYRSYPICILYNVHIYFHIFFNLADSSGQRYIYSILSPDNACYMPEVFWINLYANKILDRQQLLHNFCETKKTLCQNVCSQITLYATIFPNNETYISYAIWMKKLKCQNSSGQINLFQYSFDRSFPACKIYFRQAFQDSGK